MSRTGSQLFILEHIECRKLLWVDTLQTENLNASARKAALGCLGRALHEQHNGRRSDCLVNGGTSLGRQQTCLQRGEAGGQERVVLAWSQGRSEDLKLC